MTNYFKNLLIILLTLLTFLTPFGCGRTTEVTSGSGSSSTPSAQLPILVGFDVHFDPIPEKVDQNTKGYENDADGSKSGRTRFEEERTNLSWLKSYLDNLEAKGSDFVPRLTFEIGGDHAEYYAQDQTGIDLLKAFYQKGIHNFGTHMHKAHKVSSYYWRDLETESGADLRSNSEKVAESHITENDNLWKKILNSTDKNEIRKVFQTASGQISYQYDIYYGKYGFTFNVSGYEDMLDYFDHNVFNPWRTSGIGEDINSPYLIIPQQPLGFIGQHGGVSTVIKDNSVPALKRQFLFLYLEWLYRERNGMATKVWSFVFTDHTNNMYEDDGMYGYTRSFRDEINEFITWLNNNFIQKKSINNNLVAKWASGSEINEQFKNWEKQYPGTSSINITGLTTWDAYPYYLKGLAKTLVSSHYDSEITTFKDKGVNVHKLIKGEGGQWGFSSGKIVYSGGTTKDTYLVWTNSSDATIGFSSVLSGTLNVITAKEGTSYTTDASLLKITADPLVVYK